MALARDKMKRRIQTAASSMRRLYAGRTKLASRDRKSLGGWVAGKEANRDKQAASAGAWLSGVNYFFRTEKSSLTPDAR